ncbi:hypothetical protein GQ600_2865 [Phytophthora cactorum]|nr:hypothetical protein GQ600_2865 [Phytophthora cactorum]
MTEYHEVMKQLLDVVETIEWVQTTSLNSLDMPQGLDEYANLEKAIATTAMQRLVFSMSRISPFEEITNEALLFFRQDLWINDDCIMHAMTSLQQEFKLPIGIISPTFMGTKSAASRTVIVQKTKPFDDGTYFVLLPIHIQGNHRCGAAFDIKAIPATVTIFDPQQKRKQMDACEAIVRKLANCVRSSTNWNKNMHLAATKRCAYSCSFTKTLRQGPKTRSAVDVRTERNA